MGVKSFHNPSRNLLAIKSEPKSELKLTHANAIRNDFSDFESCGKHIEAAPSHDLNVGRRRNVMTGPPCPGPAGGPERPQGAAE